MLYYNTQQPPPWRAFGAGCQPAPSRLVDLTGDVSVEVYQLIAVAIATPNSAILAKFDSVILCCVFCVVVHVNKYTRLCDNMQVNLEDFLK